MTEAKKETRRKGYYFRDGKNYPSVSKIKNAVGDSTGLIRWGCKQGANALIAEALKNPQLFAKAEEFQRKNGNKAYTTPSLVEWAGEIAIAGYESELNRTADFGKTAHKLIENHILKNEQEFENPPAGALVALESYKAFEADIKPEYLYMEEEVINVTNKYGGRLDCAFQLHEDKLAILNPYLKKNSPAPVAGNIIVDVKTGSFMRDSHAMQLGAYRAGMFADLKIEMDGGMVIHIERDNPEDLTVHFYTREDLQKGYDAFMAAHRAWELILAPKWYAKENE